MATVFTHGQLASKLIVQGSLDKMAGKTAEKFPVEGVTLDEGRRAKLGCKPGGKTLYYEIVEKSGVFMDFSDATTTVWFRDADARDALMSFETILKLAYPNAKQVSDKANPKDETTWERSYDVPLGGDRAAVVDVYYAAPGAVPRSFIARVRAFAKR